MSDLLLWFLAGQTLSGLPQLPPGTEVRLVSADLLTVYATASVENGRLQFDTPVPSGRELRVLVFLPGASAQERAQALAGAQAYPGRVSDSGHDVLLLLPESEGPLSFARWLADEQGIELVLPEGTGGEDR